MNYEAIETAARELASNLANEMLEMRENLALENDPTVYAVALVALDDFSDVQLWMNTEEHFAETEGTATDRWYFAEWWSGGIPVDFDALTEHLGEPDSFEEADDPASSPAMSWTLAMTRAMQIARKNSAFDLGAEPVLLCSLVDSLDAIWVEELSAKVLNSAAAFQSSISGITAAQSDWYQTDDRGSDELRDAFQSAWNALQQSV